MIIKPEHCSYQVYIDTLISKQSWFPSQYTRGSLRYSKQRPSDDGKYLEDKSFLLLWNNDPVIAFFGSIVGNNESKDLLAYESHCAVIEDPEKLTTKARKFFLKHLSTILNEVDGVVKYRDFLVNGYTSSVSEYLLAKGAHGQAKYSRIIDLQYREEHLRSSVRKRYRGLINWGMKEIQPEIHNSGNINWEKILEFRDLHISVCGRETRSIKTWRRQYECILNDEAFIVLGYIDTKLVSAGYFSYSKTNCYYGVSASRRDLFEKPIFHSLMWRAIIYAKKIGCHWFDVGEQIFPNQNMNNLPTKKEIDISHFKAGFGGSNRIFLDVTL